MRNLFHSYTLPKANYYWITFCLVILALQPLYASNAVPGTERLQELDQIAFKTDPKLGRDLKTLAAHLNKSATSDYERARLAFAWVARNIRYDDASYNNGDFKNGSAEIVLKTRVAVCDGYANLYKALGEEMGLKVERISGYAKGFGYRPGSKFTQTNHAWNSVYLDGKWRLMDVTWASGSGTAANGKLKTVYRYDPYWFDVEPHEFLWTHMPRTIEHQYVASPISLDQYHTLPAPDPSLFKLGASAQSVLTNLLKGEIQSLPKTWDTTLDIKLTEVPLASSLRSGKKYTISLKAADNVDLMVKNGRDWHKFEKKGDLQTITIRPIQGKLAFMAKPKGSRGNYFYFLEYDVVK